MRHHKLIAFACMVSCLASGMLAQEAITSHAEDLTSSMTFVTDETDSKTTCNSSESLSPKNVYAELLGSSNIFGISFDSLVSLKKC